MAFGSLKDVDNWLATPGHTIGMLRGKLTSGEFAGANANWASAWVTQHDQLSAAAREDREIELLNRSTIAAEKQATRATIALVISAAALVISIVALFIKA